MTKPHYLTALFLSVLLLYSCEYVNVLTAEGEIISQNKNMGTIKKIQVEASCRLILENSQSKIIQIDGYDYLVNGLKLKCDNEVLTIDHEHHYLQKSKLIEIRIPAQLLQHITINTPCQIQCSETIDMDQFTLVVHGWGEFSETHLNTNCKHIGLYVYGKNNVGNYKFEGNTTSATYVLEGCVKVDARKLNCANVSITHKSTDYCKVYVNNQLTVKNFSSGNTYYYGDPVINFERVQVPYLKSTGKVVKGK